MTDFFNKKVYLFVCLNGWNGGPFCLTRYLVCVVPCWTYLTFLKNLVFVVCWKKSLKVKMIARYTFNSFKGPLLSISSVLLNGFPKREFEYRNVQSCTTWFLKNIIHWMHIKILFLLIQDFGMYSILVLLSETKVTVWIKHKTPLSKLSSFNFFYKQVTQ